MENDQLRQCVIDIHRRLEHLLLIHRQPTDELISINNDDESFAMRSFSF